MLVKDGEQAGKSVGKTKQVVEDQWVEGSDLAETFFFLNSC